MDQERSSKPKRRENVYIKAGTMASLVNQRRSSFNQKNTTACRPSNKERSLSMIEVHPLPIPQHAGASVAHVQTNSSTPPIEAIEEQVQSDATTLTIEEQCEEQGPSIRTRKRGKTKMKSVHGRRDRKLIVLNERDQPIGPTEAVVIKFGSFLGTLARNATLCPLDILDWRFMDTKDDIWEYTKDKYDIP